MKRKSSYESMGQRILSSGKGKAIVLIAVFAVAVMVTSSAFGAFVLSPKAGYELRSAKSSVSATPSVTPNTWPTTTMQEPGYTGGNYSMAAVASVEHLNIYLAEDLYSFFLLDEIYDSPAVIAPNNTLIPWLSTGWSETNVTGKNMTTFDPLNATMQNVSYIWTVHIRPGVQWTDWTPSGASSTYMFSNHTSFDLYNFTTGAIQGFNYTYNWSSMPMRTYEVQSADFILTWLMLSSSFDFSGTYLNIVNVEPVNNLTVQYYLSAQSASFVDYVLQDPVLPYHIWVQHDWSNTPGTWNYTASANGYDTWNMNYSEATGVATGLVGSGPFMMNGGYGMPTGNWNTATGSWDLIVNPHYFVQYVPSLEQWTPKFFELNVPKYSSISDAATAEKLGLVDTIEQGLPPTFIPTISTMPNTYIYHKPASSFGYIQLNSRPQYAPLNITAFRQALNYATDKEYISSVIDEGYNINGPNGIPSADAEWYNATAPNFPYNPSLAKSMIANISGMKLVSGVWNYKGKPVSITIQISPYSEDPLAVEGAQVIANDWNSIGVPTTVEQMSFTTQVANTINYAFQATDLGITGISGDPTGDFIVFYNSNYASAGFFFGPYTNITIAGKFYNTTQITNLVNNLTVELNLVTNLAKRISIADQIEGIVAQESTMISLGYPIDILEFTNTTFTGIIKDTLPIGSFMYWNFLSLHLRKKPLPIPTAPPVQLKVGIVTQNTVYWDGMYGNATVQVRNQYGQPVSGASVVVGYTPAGPLVNITSNNGTTNSAGIYTWEFKVSNANAIPFTNDYSGSVNIQAAASMPSAASASGQTSIDVSPYPVEYKTSGMPVLVNGSAPKEFNITVLNPSTNTPLPNYNYIIQALNGAINMTPTNTSTQTVSTLTSFNAFGFGFQNVTILNGTYDYNLTSISGSTGANGTISVWLAVNSSSVNFSAMGDPFQSWVFLGDYAGGGPMSGLSGFAPIAQLTSSSNNNPINGPEGFGVTQPVGLPVEVTTSAPTVELSLTSSAATVGYNGSASVSIRAVNATTGAGVPNYNVTLQLQNALGANRGMLLNSSGTEIQAFNPNIYFASTYLPAIELTTSAGGYANATFSADMFTSNYNSTGVFTSYSSIPFTDPYLVPFDEFQLSAVGADMQVALLTITSTAFVNSVSPVPVATGYVQSSQLVNGNMVIYGNSTYNLYVNSTLNSPYGPSTAGVAATVSVTAGSVSSATVTTSSNGSALVTYTSPNVTAIVAATITVSTSSGNSTLTLYILPKPYVAPVTVTKSKTVSTIPATLYAGLGVFVVLTVIFAALYVTANRKLHRVVKTEEKPPEHDEGQGKT